MMTTTTTTTNKDDKDFDVDKNWTRKALLSFFVLTDHSDCFLHVEPFFDHMKQHFYVLHEC